MRRTSAYAIASMCAFSCLASANPTPDHTHHVKHNMVLFGRDEIFASHLVYKAPHNFQVVLSIALSGRAKDDYQHSRTAFPGDTFIFLLDEMHIDQIQQADRLSGKILRRDGAGEKHDVSLDVTLTRGQFKTLFFNELPLSLASPYDDGPAMDRVDRDVTHVKKQRSLEPLLGYKFTETGIAFQVASGGCTTKQDFETSFLKSNPPGVLLTRKRADRCKAALPDGVVIEFSFAELGVGRLDGVTVANPIRGER